MQDNSERLIRTTGRTYFEDHIEHFVAQGDPKRIVSFLTESMEDDDEALPLQRGAWVNQVRILKKCLAGKKGYIIFEYQILRLNARIDVVLLMDGIIYSLEFKNDKDEFEPEDINQAEGYGYALKNFHSASKDRYVAPFLVATRAPISECSQEYSMGEDKLFSLFETNADLLMAYIDTVKKECKDPLPFTEEDFKAWVTAPYKANPTIIESARAIYSNNQVRDFWLFDAGEDNLSVTEDTVDQIVQEAKREKKKVICFVTGVPGAGKTLVGLDIAGKSRNNVSGDAPRSIFFSGNGPLINVLVEQLSRDAMRQDPVKYAKKSRAITEVKSFIQDLHGFKRDIISSSDPTPEESVLIFDEAQRVWDAEQMETWFEKKKSKFPLGNRSEADLLLDVLKKKEWAVIIALVGLGQDIHIGENGIRTWFESLLNRNTDWDIRLSEELFEQNADKMGDLKEQLFSLERVKVINGLHLKTSIRTPRARSISSFCEALLENRPEDAKKAIAEFDGYPIYVTRDLAEAKKWTFENRKRKERCGALYSSNGKYTKKSFSQLNNYYVAKWFIDREGPDSSNSLTYAASEFDVQGLELDWALLCWDMDLYHDGGKWNQQRMLSKSFFKESDDALKKHILNSYRVLLTRARKGMVIYLPRVSPFEDLYGVASYYDTTYDYLLSCGVKPLRDSMSSRIEKKKI
ncbi:MAG: DUF2075 domain-containing protein, partial [Bacilli bacterium]|nr:DUF2075 domain-containing protein [Bacilli bacterium]